MIGTGFFRRSQLAITPPHGGIFPHDSFELRDGDVAVRRRLREVIVCRFQPVEQPGDPRDQPLVIRRRRGGQERKIGARFFIASDIPLTHLGGGSAQSNTSRALQHDRAQQYVFKKHFGMQGLLLSKAFRILRSSVRIASALPHLGSSEKRKYLLHHMALLKAALW